MYLQSFPEYADLVAYWNGQMELTLANEYAIAEAIEDAEWAARALLRLQHAAVQVQQHVDPYSQQHIILLSLYDVICETESTLAAHARRARLALGATHVSASN